VLSLYGSQQSSPGKVFVAKCYALFSDRTFPHIGVGGISAGWPDWRRVL
jgi:hypothetical protein